MRKKLMTIVLVCLLCVSLTAPAFADADSEDFLSDYLTDGEEESSDFADGVEAQDDPCENEHTFTTVGMTKTCSVCGYTEYIDGLYKDNGDWCYFENGEKSSYTGFAENENGKWYVENGNVTFTKQDILQDTTGVLGEKNAWYYVIDSKVQTSFTGLSNFSNENGWWYIDSGEVDFTHTGVDKNTNGWWYVTDGKVDFNYNGFASNSNGKWYVNNGKVTFTKQGILQDKAGMLGEKNAWYYVIDSKVQTSFTGLGNFGNSNGWWYIKNGKVDFSHNGVDKNINGWYYVTGGKVQFGYTGVANYKNSNGWWYIKNGKVDFTHAGIDKNVNGWWKVVDGKVDFSANTVANNSNGWWVIRDGKVRFDFTGLAANSNGVWYAKNGKVQFNASGSKSIRGVTFKVSNGKAVISSSSLVTGGSSSDRAAANSYICKFPANAMLALLDQGETVKFVNHFTWDYNGTATGMACGYEVELRNGAYGTDFSVLHELAHSLDYHLRTTNSNLAWFSNSTEFKNIMNAEIGAYRRTFTDKNIDSDLLNTLTSTSYREYFADAFSMYCRYNSDLKKNCPKTYAYIQKAIELV